MKASVVAIAFVTLAAAQAGAGPIRVAVEDGTGRGGGAATVAQLNDDTFFDFDATLVSAAAIDTATELSAFDVVVLGGSGFNDADWTVAMSSALRTWVLGGGGVVATGWFNFDVRSGDATAADLDFLISGQNAVSNNQFESPGTLNFVNTTHPVTIGLSNFSTGASFTEVNRFPLEPNDTLLANMVGSPESVSVAIKDPLGLGRSVYLGPIYLASVTQYSTASLRSGQSDRLLEQAVGWASASSPVVVPEPSSLLLLGSGLLGILAKRQRQRAPKA